MKRKKCSKCRDPIKTKYAYQNGRIVCQSCFTPKNSKESSLLRYYRSWIKKGPKSRKKFKISKIVNQTQKYLLLDKFGDIIEKYRLKNTAIYKRKPNQLIVTLEEYNSRNVRNVTTKRKNKGL